MTDPIDALKQVQDARAHMAERYTRGSWLYDLFYALLVGGLVATMALPMPYLLINETVLLVCLVILARWWRNRTGMWMSGVQPARARWVAIGIGGLMVVLTVLNLWWSHNGAELWAPVATGLAGVLMAFFGSRLWTSVYRRESGL